MNIKSITPATNWYALYEDSQKSSQIRIALVCWALVDDNDVLGMVATETGEVMFANEYAPEADFSYQRYELMLDEVELGEFDLSDLN